MLVALPYLETLVAKRVEAWNFFPYFSIAFAVTLFGVDFLAMVGYKRDPKGTAIKIGILCVVLALISLVIMLRFKHRGAELIKLLVDGGIREVHCEWLQGEKIRKLDKYLSWNIFMDLSAPLGNSLMMAVVVGVFMYFYVQYLISHLDFEEVDYTFWVLSIPLQLVGIQGSLGRQITDEVKFWVAAKYQDCSFKVKGAMPGSDLIFSTGPVKWWGIELRVLCSTLVNQGVPLFVIQTLPLLMLRAVAPFDFVTLAVSINFVSTLDELATEKELVFKTKEDTENRRDQEGQRERRDQGGAQGGQQ